MLSTKIMELIYNCKEDETATSTSRARLIEDYINQLQELLQEKSNLKKEAPSELSAEIDHQLNLLAQLKTRKSNMPAIQINTMVTLYLISKLTLTDLHCSKSDSVNLISECQYDFIATNQEFDSSKIMNYLNSEKIAQFVTEHISQSPQHFRILLHDAITAAINDYKNSYGGWYGITIGQIPFLSSYTNRITDANIICNSLQAHAANQDLDFKTVLDLFKVILTGNDSHWEPNSFNTLVINYFLKNVTKFDLDFTPKAQEIYQKILSYAEAKYTKTITPSNHAEANYFNPLFFQQQKIQETNKQNITTEITKNSDQTTPSHNPFFQ